MKVREVIQWLILASMLVSGGMQLGRIQQQVTDNAAKFRYVNGDISVPHSAKEE